MRNRDEIIKILVGLFDVEPSPENETEIFQDVKHAELLEALEFWIDQCKMIFGEVVHTEKTQSLQDAGVDVCVNLMESKFRFGIQVKSYLDIQQGDFSKRVKAQTFDSGVYQLNKYVILFAGNLITQREKVQGMIAVLSQRNTDQRIITVPPSKLLTIFNAYRNNVHPLKLAFLDVLDLGKTLAAIAENMNNRNREIKIDTKIEYRKDSVERPHSFKVNYSLDKKDIDKIKVQDDLEHLDVTDEVIRMKKDDYDKLTITDETGESIPDEVLIWNEKPNRIFMQLQALSHESKILSTYSELIDITREDNIQKFKAIDTKKPLEFSFEVNLTSGRWNFYFNTRYNGFAVDDLYEMIMFLTQIRNAAFLRLHIPKDNVTQIIPVQDPIQIDLSPALIDLIFKLNLLQELSGLKLTLAVESDEDTAELHYMVNVIVSLYLAHKASSKNITHTNVKLPKDKALELMTNYKENKVKKDHVIRTAYTMNILNHDITVPNIDIILADFHPITDISVIEQGSESEYEITLEANQSAPHV